MLNIIIPTYKARKTLPDALNSLVAQTTNNFFVTISQDGDGEDYTDIIEEYKRRGLHIKHINCPENGGPGMARQRAIDDSELFDYLMFLDSDDMLMPRAAEYLYREAKLNNVDILSSSFLYEAENKTHSYYTKDNPSVCWLHGRIYRTKFLMDNNIRFLEGIRVNEDSYFNLVAMNCAKKKAYLEEVMYIWRFNKNSITRRNSEKISHLEGTKPYCIGQVRGLRKIFDTNKEALTAFLLAATLINIYEQSMVNRYLENEDTYLIEYFSLIRDVPEIMELIKSADFWNYVALNLKPCKKFNDMLLFFKQRFTDWLKEYVQLEEL